MEPDELAFGRPMLKELQAIGAGGVLLIGLGLALYVLGMAL